MSKVPHGKAVVIMKAGKPWVRPTRVATAPGQRKIGTAKSDFEVPENLYAPLPDHVLDDFEG
jgi:hypothetical protein